MTVLHHVKKHPIRPASEICSHRWSSENVYRAYRRRDFIHTNQTLSPGLVFPSIKIYKLSGNFFPWLQAWKLKHGWAEPARITNLNVSSSHRFKFQPGTSLKSCCWNQVAYHRTPLQTQSLGIKELPLQSAWSFRSIDDKPMSEKPWLSIHVSLEHPNTNTWAWHLIGMTILPPKRRVRHPKLYRYVEA